MSHETIIRGLKDLINAELLSIHPNEHTAHVQRESDRSAIILHASSIETCLVYLLKDKMGHLNGEEIKRLFDFEGPIGSFSNRIRMAHALGLIDRPQKKRIEIIKEMRNAAAHCHDVVSFETEAIRQAVFGLYGRSAATLEEWPGSQTRVLFDLFCVNFTSKLTGDDRALSPEEVFSVALDRRAGRQ